MTHFTIVWRLTRVIVEAEDEDDAWLVYRRDAFDPGLARPPRAEVVIRPTTDAEMAEVGRLRRRYRKTMPMFDASAYRKGRG